MNFDVNALMEKAVEIQYTDKPDFGEDSALGYGRKEGYKEVGVIGTSARTAMVIFKLNAFDKKYTKSVRLKAGEEIFRYTSRGTVAGSIMPLIKVNMKRGLAYYLTQESSSGEIDEPVFETKSQKLKFIRLLTSAYKPGHIVKEDVELDEALMTTHVVVDTAQGNKVVSSAAGENAEKNLRMNIASAERPPLSIKDKKTLKVVKLKKPLSRKKADDLMGQPLKESVEQIDEIVAKLNKNGEIEMTKKKYAKVHRDFKGKWPDGEHYVTQHMGRQGMTQVPVKFVKEDAELDEKMDRETKKTARSLMRLGDNPRLAVKTAKAGAKKSSASKAAYRKAYESVDQVDENQDIKATAPKAKATKVGQRATTPSDIGRKYPDNKWVVKKNTGTSKAYRPLEWVLESVDEAMYRDSKSYSKMDMQKKTDKKNQANKLSQRKTVKGHKFANEDVEHLDELTQREKEMIADRKAKRDTKAGRKDKKTRLIPKTTTYVRPSKGEDDHIVMQLRKAQDSANFGNGEFGYQGISSQRCSDCQPEETSDR